MAQLWQHHRWQTDTRYYEVFLHQDLWGGWILTQAWGGRGTHLGRVKHRACVDYAEGLQRLEKIERRRVQRGYGRCLF
jgi:predicted DNA-binding WGR domain protein